MLDCNPASAAPASSTPLDLMGGDHAGHHGLRERARRRLSRRRVPYHQAAGQAMVPGTHGSTFGGNPLATRPGRRPARRFLDVVLEPGFLEYVAQMGLRLKQLRRRCGRARRDCRRSAGAGAVMGLKCKRPNAELFSALRERGMRGSRASRRPMSCACCRRDRRRSEIDLASRTIDAACAAWRVRGRARPSHYLSSSF